MKCDHDWRYYSARHRSCDKCNTCEVLIVDEGDRVWGNREWKIFDLDDWKCDLSHYEEWIRKDEEREMYKVLIMCFAGGVLPILAICLGISYGYLGLFLGFLPLPLTVLILSKVGGKKY